jgi:hypothetical protein
MSETIKKMLYQHVEKDLSLYLDALHYFEQNEHFIYPLERGGLQRDENLRSRMDVLHRIGLVRIEDVSSWLFTNDAKDIRVYELNDEGRKIFVEAFNAEPKMCGHSHWATPG